MKIISISVVALLCTTLFSTQVSASEIFTGNIQVDGYGDLYRVNDPDDTDNLSYEWSINAMSWDGTHQWSINSAYAGANIISLNIGESTAGNAIDTLKVDSSGDIYLADGSVSIDKSANYLGIGTTIPTEDIHVVNTTTKTKHLGGIIAVDLTVGDASIKLDAYDSTSWKIGAKYSKVDIAPYASKSFAITDNNTSTSPFIIYQGAPTNSLRILQDSVNVGTKLDVKGTIKSSDAITTTWAGESTENDDGLVNLMLLSANNSATDLGSDAGFALKNEKEGRQWDFRTSWKGNAFMATKHASVGAELMVLNQEQGEGGERPGISQTKVFFGGVKVFENGHLVTASSRELKTDIKPLDTQAALDALHKLQPVSYEYKTQKGEPVVGFIAEDVPELVAMPSRKSFDSTEVVAVLTSVLKEQEKQLNLQAEKIAKLEAMQKRLARVESLLTNLALDTSHTKTEKVSLNSK